MLVLLDNKKLPANLAHCRAAHRLDAFDQRLLDLFARNVSIECDNVEALRLSSSLETAHQIQDAMLPTDFGDIARAYDVDVHAVLRPAKQVGGDLYDFFALDEEKLCLVVGDVADKNIPAALFMATTRTLVRAAAETHADAGAILRKVNTALCQGNRQMMFVTLFIAVYARGSGELGYANAGHSPPLFRSADGQVSELPAATNIALGVLENATFSVQTATLPVGATLLLFTDGITEAMNAGGEQFRTERLMSLLASKGAAPAADFVAGLVAAVDEFAGDTPQSDDLTLLCLRRRESPGPGH